MPLAHPPTRSTWATSPVPGPPEPVSFAAPCPCGQPAVWRSASDAGAQLLDPAINHPGPCRPTRHQETPMPRPDLSLVSPPLPAPRVPDDVTRVVHARARRIRQLLLAARERAIREEQPAAAAAIATRQAGEYAAVSRELLATVRDLTAGVAVDAGPDGAGVVVRGPDAATVDGTLRDVAAALGRACRRLEAADVAAAEELTRLAADTHRRLDAIRRARAAVSYDYPAAPAAPVDEAGAGGEDGAS